MKEEGSNAAIETPCCTLKRLILIYCVAVSRPEWYGYIHWMYLRNSTKAILYNKGCGCYIIKCHDTRGCHGLHTVGIVHYNGHTRLINAHDMNRKRYMQTTQHGHVFNFECSHRTPPPVQTRYQIHHAKPSIHCCWIQCFKFQYRIIYCSIWILITKRFIHVWCNSWKQQNYMLLIFRNG
jgi:hypothetical protein